MMVRCIELDRSCADLFSFALSEMARSSQFAERVRRLCAEVCDACGEECAKHKMDHCQECAEACRTCAEACRTCAEACREMAGAGSSPSAATDLPLHPSRA